MGYSEGFFHVRGICVTLIFVSYSLALMYKATRCRSKVLSVSQRGCPCPFSESPPPSFPQRAPPQGEEEESSPALSSRPVPRPLRRCWNSERKPEPEAGGPGQEKKDTEFSGKAFGCNPREPRPTQAKLSSVFKKKVTFAHIQVRDGLT